MQSVQQGQDEGQGMTLAAYLGRQAAARDDTLRGDMADMKLVFGKVSTMWKASALLVSIKFGEVGVLAMQHR